MNVAARRVNIAAVASARWHLHGIALGSRVRLYGRSPHVVRGGTVVIGNRVFTRRSPASKLAPLTEVS